MGLKEYFKSIRDQEAEINEEFPLIVSTDTADGGKCGACIEVSREQAARTIVEGRARLATEAERQAYREREAEKKRQIEAADLSKRLQIALVTEPEFRQLKSKPSREKKREEEKR